MQGLVECVEFTQRETNMRRMEKRRGVVDITFINANTMPTFDSSDTTGNAAISGGSTWSLTLTPNERNILQSIIKWCKTKDIILVKVIECIYSNTSPVHISLVHIFP